MSVTVEFIDCSRCGTLTVFEAIDGTYPEGEKCDGPCDRWVCPDCVDDSVQDENLCYDCSEERRRDEKRGLYPQHEDPAN